MDVWPVPMNSPLPTIGTPLVAGDADVPLDLQAALTTVYDVMRYDLAISYAKPPPVRIPPDELAWARELLATKGFNTSRWELKQPAL